jgi:hypothetical protein
MQVPTFPEWKAHGYVSDDPEFCWKSVVRTGAMSWWVLDESCFMHKN